MIMLRATFNCNDVIVYMQFTGAPTVDHLISLKNMQGPLGFGHFCDNLRRGLKQDVGESIADSTT